MGIRASYWATGGILALIGVAVARLVLGFVGPIALAVGAFLLKAALVGMVLLVLGLIAGLVVFAVRRRRRPAQV